MGVRVQGVGNNDPAQDAHYFNLAAEMWWTLAAKLGRGEMVLPWKDDVLKKQMLGREEVYRQVDGVKVYGLDDEYWAKLYLNFSAWNRLSRSVVTVASSDCGFWVVAA